MRVALGAERARRAAADRRPGAAAGRHRHRARHRRRVRRHAGGCRACSTTSSRPIRSASAWSRLFLLGVALIGQLHPGPARDGGRSADRDPQRLRQAANPRNPASSPLEVPAGAGIVVSSEVQLDLPFLRTSPAPEPRVEFVRVRRARKYILRVRPDGTLRVTIPRGGSRREAEAFVAEHRRWVDEERVRVASRHAPVEWYAGESVPAARRADRRSRPSRGDAAASSCSRGCARASRPTPSTFDPRSRPRCGTSPRAS